MIKLKRILSIVIFVACVLVGNILLIQGLDKEQQMQFDTTQMHLDYINNIK